MISLDRMETLLHYTLDEILMVPYGLDSGGDSHASCF